MNLFGVLFTVLVVVLLAGLGLLVWGLVEGWRDERRLAKERARAERRLRQQAFRVQGEMLRHVVQRMDQPQRPRQRQGGRHG